RNVIVICGVNKIVEDISEGIDRTRNVASPPNCVRLNKKTPCAVTGKCSHCNSPDTICKATVIQHHPTTNSNVKIILINKNLGY
ncbi:MAG: LUD domain-containing protein, partial [Clostridia bacterium]|nr:LUD domain-containing protein [Clostridia bacterium]